MKKANAAIRHGIAVFAAKINLRSYGVGCFTMSTPRDNWATTPEKASTDS